MFKFKKLPTHIAIIMDGNGRWAKRRGLPRNAGHKAGINALEKTVDACLKYGIKYCTVYAFSTENWKRSDEEINGIFSLARDYLYKNEEFYLKKEIKLNTIGVLDPFPNDLKAAISNLKQKTKDFDKLTVTIALNYGGRDEIVRTVNNLIKQNYKSVTEKDILLNLDTKDIPEPDLIIRTSGEQRLSNFLLYQMAYSELYFTKIYWPDFDEKHLVKALKNFQKRKRNYGGVKT